MKKEVAIRLIKKKFDVTKGVAKEFYMLYENTNKLNDLYILLHDLDLEEYAKNKQQETIYE